MSRKQGSSYFQPLWIACFCQENVWKTYLVRCGDRIVYVLSHVKVISKFGKSKNKQRAVTAMAKPCRIICKTIRRSKVFAKSYIICRSEILLAGLEVKKMLRIHFEKMIYDVLLK